MAERNNRAEYDALEEEALQELFAPSYTGDDGLLYCGTCKTPKQRRHTTEDGRVYLVHAECECHKRAKRLRLFREMQSGIEDDRAKGATFAKDDGADRESSLLLRRYAEKWDEMRRENIGLLLHGDVGGGKTFFAACVANAIIEKAIKEGREHPVPIMLTTIPALRDEMQRDFGSQKARILREIAETPLLILDDIGFEKSTPAAAELAFDIVNQRYKANAPLIVTTNLTIGDITNAQDMKQKRIFDRIVEMCSPVYIKAEGRRQAIARNKSAEARRILGI